MRGQRDREGERGGDADGERGDRNVEAGSNPIRAGDRLEREAETAASLTTPVPRTDVSTAGPTERKTHECSQSECRVPILSSELSGGCELKPQLNNTSHP